MGCFSICHFQTNSLNPSNANLGVNRAKTVPYRIFCQVIQVFFVFVCFSNPTSPPRNPIGSVPCVPSYTLSYPAFKGVTRGMSFKHTFPPHCCPWYMQVWPGAWSRPIIWETFTRYPDLEFPGSP